MCKSCATNEIPDAVVFLGLAGGVIMSIKTLVDVYNCCSAWIAKKTNQYDQKNEKAIQLMQTTSEQLCSLSKSVNIIAKAVEEKIVGNNNPNQAKE